MKKLAIIGAGDLGQQIAYYAINDKQYNVVGFFDDTISKGIDVMNIPILGNISYIKESFLANDFDCLLIGIGYRHMSFRKKIFNSLIEIVPFTTFIHSSSHVEKSAKIEAGSIVFPQNIIDHNVIIHQNVLVNIGCSISHDSHINSHTFLSPRVAIAGFCKIGSQNIIGINSTIIDNINTVEKTQLGGATVLIENTIKEGLYVGSPARFIK